MWIAETVNTAFEYLYDVVTPQLHDGVAKAEDIAAGAVLIAAIAAGIVGLMIFLPHLSVRFCDWSTGIGRPAGIGRRRIGR